MRKVTRWLLLVSLMATSLMGQTVINIDDDDDINFTGLGHGFTGVEDVRIKVKRHAVRITPEDDDKYWGRVEITDDMRLLVNGDEVKVSKKAKKLMEKYYEQSEEVLYQARKIGYEGAQVGMEGAKLGVKAIAGVFRLLSPDYDEDDLERDMEKESRKIEKKAERLEEKAEVIEDMVDELEETHVALRKEVKDLKKLRWF